MSPYFKAPTSAVYEIPLFMTAWLKVCLVNEVSHVWVDEYDKKKGFTNLESLQ